MGAAFNDGLIHCKGRGEASSVALNEVVLSLLSSRIYSGQILNKFKEVSLQLQLQYNTLREN